jgi:hypothetical protein
MSEESKSGRELIVIAFSAVAVVAVLHIVHQLVISGTFAFKGLLTIVLSAFLCLRVLLKNEWAKYAAIIWALGNIAVSLALVFNQKLYFHLSVAAVFCFLIAILSFSKVVDAYLVDEVTESSSENQI